VLLTSYITSGQVYTRVFKWSRFRRLK